MANIKKIKLSNGSVYSIFDEGALRLNKGPDGSKKYPDSPDDLLITGNAIVDSVLLEGVLKITEIDDVPVGTAIDNVMVAENIGTAEDPVYQVKKRSIDQLLEDIGGISYSMNDST